MNNNLKRILPKDWKSYNVSYDKELLKICQDIWERNEDNLTPRCEVDGFVYRSVADLGEDNISNKKIRDYFGHYKITVIQAEYHVAHSIVSRLHLIGGRVPGIRRDKNIDKELQDYNYDSYISSFWHLDFGLRLNNFSLVVYLTDVDKGMGGTILSDPPIVPTYDEKTKETTIIDDENYNKWTSTEIPQIEVTGTAGTTVVFHSHRLHRASLPSRGYRKTVSMWVRSPLEEHRADPYVYSNCKPSRTLESL